MAAPKENQFWRQRSKHGRDKLFETPDALLEAAHSYFQWCDDNPWLKTEQLRRPTITQDTEGNQTLHTVAELPTARPYTLKGLCLHLDVTPEWWSRFRKKHEADGEEGFSQVISRVEDIIYTQKFEGAVVGAFNANIISRDLGLVDKKEHGGKIEIEQITGMNIISTTPPSTP
jgi:hypothetical protein